MKEITIHTEYITLGQFLKLAECISSGGQAKPFLQDTTIYVNDQAENRRGRKLYQDFIIQVKGHGVFKVVREENGCS